MDNELSFQLEGGRIFNFVLLNDKLVKLGDGSFGVVFLVEENGQYFAAKLLYGIFDNKNAPALKEFKREMGILKIIRSGSGINRPPRIVNIIDGTEQFHHSNAYKTLKNQFENDFKIEVSQYAEVMELYPYTLKDLLERGPIEDYRPWEKPNKRKAKYVVPPEILEEVFGSIETASKELREAYTSRDELEVKINSTDWPDEQKEKLKNSIINRIGYELLKSLSFEERIETIWPILSHLVAGLEVLHSLKNATIAHLDLKPANIFIDNPGGAIEAYIGDFGFTNVAIALGGTYLLSEEALPLGTLHYRSPEQKDYRDVCYAKVTHENEKVILEIKDPKFNGTIIEDGDFIIFSKDSSRRSYDISKIEFGNEKEPTKLTINAKVGSISSDEYTQIWLYKRQDDRTDIFGVGAIAYDLLTCGKSPERFYEGIRRFERKDNGEEGTVKDVIEKYIQVSEYKSTEAGLAPIFEPFRDSRTGKYAPKWFVEWIVKCFLYQAQDTYFSVAKQSNGEELNPFTSIKSDLQKFIRPNSEGKEPLISRVLAENNPLLTLEAPTIPSTEANRFADKLEALQNQKNLNFRPIQGVYFFKELVELLRNKFQGSLTEENRFFFFELLPENLIYIGGDRVVGGSRFEVSNHLFKDQDAFLYDLRADEVNKRFIQDILNPFVPARITFMRRRINLTNDNEGSDSFIYSFLDSSQLDEKVKSGDWIIKNDEIYRVIETIGGKKIKITRDLLENVVEDDSINIKGGEAILYYDLDRRKYYLEMLGLYIYNLFFAENEHIGASRSKFNPVDLFPENRRKIKTLSKPPEKGILGGKISDEDWYDWIYHTVAIIIAKLFYHGLENSYYQSAFDQNSTNKEFTDRIGGIILADIGQLKNGIERCFNFTPGELDFLKQPVENNQLDINIKPRSDWRFRKIIASSFR